MPFGTDRVSHGAFHTVFAAFATAAIVTGVAPAWEPRIEKVKPSSAWFAVADSTTLPESCASATGSVIEKSTGIEDGGDATFETMTFTGALGTTTPSLVARAM